MQDIQHFQTQSKPSCPPSSVLSTEKGYEGGDGGGKKSLITRKPTSAHYSDSVHRQGSCCCSQPAAGTAVGAGQGTHEEYTKGLLLQQQFLSGEGRAGP